ncbi:hypothetical protein [Bacillus subtilis]|nr:hypothetical protein [Bacillus subtilis]
MAISAREIDPFANTVRMTALVEIFRAIGVCATEDVIAIRLAQSN